MKKWLLIITLLQLMMQGTIAQNIDRVEYFFDKDSGVGKCMPLSIGTIKDTVTMNASVSTGNLANGMHTINIRAKNIAGKYSHYRSQMFYVSTDVNPMPPLVGGEYFIDDDPGIGQGLPATKLHFTTPGATVVQTFNLSIPGLDTGTHYLYLRVKDAAGHWSFYNDSFQLFTLPVTALHLTAEKQNKNVLLHWYTLQENNTNRFIIEKSTNGISFLPMGEMKAGGTTTERKDYCFNDLNPVAGLNFYRIKQTDNDGKYTYSLIKKLWFDEVSGNLKFYPNPANDILRLGFKNNLEPVIANLYDAGGKWVCMYHLPVSGSLQININNLVPGTYTVHVSNGLITQNGRFVKK